MAMTEEKRVLVKEMVQLDEAYCDSMIHLGERMLALMDDDDRLLGKKVICDGMAKSKAETGVELCKLLMRG